MTDRRPLGTGPAPADTGVLPGPHVVQLRAQLAAERLPTVSAAAEPKPRPAAGRRALGSGPASPGR
ncbi:hypothetical protein [Streptomyces ambofaciens]